MGDIQGWSDPRLLEFLNQLCRMAGKGLENAQSRVDQDDLHQEVFLRLNKTGELTGQPIAVWEAYLRQTVNTTVVDLQRSHLLADKRSAYNETSTSAPSTGQGADSTPSIGSILPSGHTSPTGRARTNEELQLLEAAIERLPSRQAQAIQYQNEGKGPSEIAELMGITADAASSLLYHATNRLIEMLNPDAE